MIGERRVRELQEDAGLVVACVVVFVGAVALIVSLGLPWFVGVLLVEVAVLAGVVGVAAFASVLRGLGRR